MTEYEEDASIGRLSKELAATRRRHEAASAELRRKAMRLQELGAALIDNPDRVVFPGGRMPVSTGTALILNEDLSLATLHKLAVVERETREALQDLERRARLAGL